MNEGRSWQSNWKVRLYERVRERGYNSLTAFAEARPTASLVALADELGEDDIAAVQVFSGLVAKAEPPRWAALREHHVAEKNGALAIRVPQDEGVSAPGLLLRSHELHYDTSQPLVLASWLRR